MAVLSDRLTGGNTTSTLAVQVRMRTATLLRLLNLDFMISVIVDGGNMFMRAGPSRQRRKERTQKETTRK